MNALGMSGLEGLSLGELITTASAQPVIDQDHEEILIDRCRTGDPEALEKLVFCNLRIAIDEAIRSRGLGSPQQELIRTGVRTLLDAARRYDPATSGRFSHFARRRVRQVVRDRVSIS